MYRELENLKAGTGRRCEKKVEQAHSILDAANLLIADVGYESFTMDELAIKAGVSKPTLYQYFGSKQELFIQAVIARIRNGKAFAQSLDPALPAIHRLELVLNNFYGLCYTNALASMGPALYGTLIPTLRADPDYQREFDAMFSTLCSLIEEGRNEGSIHSSVPNEILAQIIVSVLRDKDYARHISAGVCQAESLAKMLTQVVLYGITSEPQPTGGSSL